MGRIDIKERLANAEEITFLPSAMEFIESFGFPIDLLEDAVRYPEVIETDPKSVEAGYPVLRLRRGDITLSVSFKESWDHPYVMYLHLNNPGENELPSPQQKYRKSGGTGGGSQMPTSTAGIQAWFLRNGCQVQPSADGMRITYEGRLVGVLHLTVHSRGSALKNKFKDLTRIYREIRADIAREYIEQTRAARSQ